MPPSMRNGKKCVKIVEDDMDGLAIYWKIVSHNSKVGYNYGVSVGYSLKDALSKVASAIVEPIHMDNFTNDMTQISYARVLLEVHVAQPLLDKIYISTPYGEFQQSVDYDWRPKLCSSCMKFVHELLHCWNKNDRGVIEREFQEKRK
ncbi:hypothetical protein H5410_041218 [Solanum commersonii]|uniref:Uncharacterized protein n=1 Tax=Solanum commersonii TaxID=4109 RepID=A0A9J5XU59_SOLCO|nr:hypothetical protein H5410_041218 [Solanum commersonii]